MPRDTPRCSTAVLATITAISTSPARTIAPTARTSGACSEEGSIGHPASVHSDAADIRSLCEGQCRYLPRGRCTYLWAELQGHGPGHLHCECLQGRQAGGR